MIKAEVLQGDCKERLKDIHPDSIDLILTSPPYAEQRKATYGGIPESEYIDWFEPIQAALWRVLKPEGTFLLNIREHARGGQLSTYVIELILALRKQGWRWTEEFIWHKRNPCPGKHKGRLINAWERILQFNKTGEYKFYPDAVMVEASENTKRKAAWAVRTGQSNKSTLSSTGSGFTNSPMQIYQDRDKIYPNNVVHLGRGTRGMQHPATFPEQIPDFFIRLFTQERDTVLDPFAGSGTTMKVAYQLRRHSIGIERMPEYCEHIRADLSRFNGYLF